MNSTKISFHFQPNGFDKLAHTVEKEDKEGIKRRYIRGISSGLRTDGHEERMTSKCIKSFMSQANSGDVLLYADIHGIKASDDIGRLEESEVTSNGDWSTDYRLYDEHDGIGPAKLERIETIWRQLKGLPPYRKPKQKGFSIEGNIPSGGILSGEKDNEGNIKKRVIDDVVLDGVILVPRPAYKDSIATAVFKALGEIQPEFRANLEKSIKGELKRRIEEEEIQDSYYKEKWNINDGLEAQIERIMSRDSDSRKEGQLEILFDEYKDLMVKVIIGSEGLFIKNKKKDKDYEPYGSTSIRKDAKIELFEGVLNQLTTLQKRLS